MSASVFAGASEHALSRAIRPAAQKTAKQRFIIFLPGGEVYVGISYDFNMGTGSGRQPGTKIRCFDYVNHPYERVRNALSKDAGALFQSATRAAASRAQSVAS